MSISLLARSIAESPTLRLNEEARLLKERGESVVHLGAGEPKNKAPIAAILASAAKLVSGDVKYVPTDGLPSLKKAILRYTEENYDRVVAPRLPPMPSQRAFRFSRITMTTRGRARTPTKHCSRWRM